MARFTVTPEELRASASKFTQESQNIQQTLQTIKREIENLRSTWTGPASGKFDGLMTKWNTDADGIRQVLDQVIEHLNKSAQHYEDTERGIEQSYNY